MEEIQIYFLDKIHTTYNIDSNDSERKITCDIIMILAAHVYGNLYYIEHIQEITDVERYVEIIRKIV